MALQKALAGGELAKRKNPSHGDVTQYSGLMRKEINQSFRRDEGKTSKVCELRIES